MGGRKREVKEGPPQVLEQRKQVCFLKRTQVCKFKVCFSCFRKFSGFSAWQTSPCPQFSVVSETTHEARRGPQKGTVSAHKAFQGSKTETNELLGGTVFPR